MKKWMMIMNIYELTADFLRLQEMIEDPDVESDEIQAVMDELNDQLEKKADGYAKMIRNLEGNLAAVKTEQQKLNEKKNLLEAGIKRLKEDLQTAMIATGKRKFKTDLFSFNIQKNGGADPVIVDVATDELPDDLVIISEKPDLKAIAAYIKETGDITFAHFGERGESLRIK
jgi:mitochondrial fission protein ELM1